MNIQYSKRSVKTINGMDKPTKQIRITPLNILNNKKGVFYDY